MGYIDDNKKLASIYSAADVIVVPSLEETFSNTTAEAIACGTPVVGFKTGAIPDLAVEGVTGQAVEVGDVESLANAVIEILFNQEIEPSKIRSFALDNLEFSLQAQRYEELFNDLLKTKQDLSRDDVSLPHFLDFNISISKLYQKYYS